MKAERKLLVISATAGLAAAFLGYYILSEKEKQLVAELRPANVVVAAKYIAPKTRISKDMIRYEKIPGRYITRAHTDDYEKILGRITAVPFLKGEPVLTNKISGNEQDLNAAIPTGLRALSVKVNEETGVSNMISPGDYVDVLLTFQTEKNKKIFTVTATVLQAVSVIAVGSSFVDEKRKTTYSAVTLALTPEEAELLTFAKSKGEINLALRPLGDRKKQKVKLASFEQLFEHIKRNEKGDYELREEYFAAEIEKDKNEKFEIKKREE
ncbi:MAG: Flp pilus assembly protein CpaB [Candidatus Goldiibacteriota bacterium]